jgi:hypothetical protein
MSRAVMVRTSTRTVVSVTSQGTAFSHFSSCLKVSQDPDLPAHPPRVPPARFEAHPRTPTRIRRRGVHSRRVLPPIILTRRTCPPSPSEFRFSPPRTVDFHFDRLPDYTSAGPDDSPESTDVSWRSSGVWTWRWRRKYGIAPPWVDG